MKIDNYTKIVLTVIAIMLTWICLRDIPFIKQVYAGSGSEGFVTVTNTSPIPVAIYAHVKNSNGNYNWGPVEAIKTDPYDYNNNSCLLVKQKE